MLREHMAEDSQGSRFALTLLIIVDFCETSSLSYMNHLTHLVHLQIFLVSPFVCKGTVHLSELSV